MPDWLVPCDEDWSRGREATDTQAGGGRTVCREVDHRGPADRHEDATDRQPVWLHGSDRCDSVLQHSPRRVSHGWDPPAEGPWGQRGRQEMGDRGGPIIGGRLAEALIPADSLGIIWSPAPPVRPRPRSHASSAHSPSARRARSFRFAAPPAPRASRVRTPRPRRRSAPTHAPHTLDPGFAVGWRRPERQRAFERVAGFQAADRRVVPVHSKNGTPRSRWLSGRAAPGVPQEPVPSRYWKVRWHSFPRQTTSPMSRVPWCR